MIDIKLPKEKFFICWSPRLLLIILGAGFKLWEDPNCAQDNPFLDIKKRYDENGNLATPKTGYIFERTDELMNLVKRYSQNKLVR